MLSKMLVVLNRKKSMLMHKVIMQIALTKYDILTCSDERRRHEKRQDGFYTEI